MMKMIVILSTAFLGACCKEMEPQLIDVALDNFLITPYTEFEVTEPSETSSLEDLTLVLVYETSGLETFQEPDNKGFLRSPDCDSPGFSLFMGDPVASFIITTTSDINDVYKAGTDLSDMAVLRIINLNPMLEEPEYRNVIPIDIETINSFITQSEELTELYGMDPFLLLGVRLNLAIIEDTSGQFQITLVTTAGRSLSAATDFINLKAS